MKQLIECVPNFSEGRNMDIIRQITDEIQGVAGIQLLDVDPGKATNRTVVTFVGEPSAVVEAAFLAIQKAAELIDMRQHKGAHPRFGATDVCPLIPISGITIEDTIPFAQQLAERIGTELGIPNYLYESAATHPERKNLAAIRAGEYEGLPKKLAHPNWKPDFGPPKFNERIAQTGATVIGVRDFLVAYNVNLNTTSTRRANAVAFDVREKGRVKRGRGQLKGQIIRDENGKVVRVPGMLKSVKAIGWYIEEYGIAQISMNLTNISITSIHEAFDAVCTSAQNRGMRVTGSELIGLIPLKEMLAAGKYFLHKQKRSLGVSEAELIRIAIKSMGLNELAPFNPNKKIIEYVLQDTSQQPLIQMSLQQFATETASESPAPGGGSISAYVGTLGAALGTMVANLSAHKRTWDDRWKLFSDWAEKGQLIVQQLLKLVDEDTYAFNQIIAAIRLPKQTNADQQARLAAIESATKYAIEVPFKVMETAFRSMELLKAMATIGSPNSASDVGVGVACVRTAVLGALLNVKINAKDLEDQAWAKTKIKAGEELWIQTQELEGEILLLVEQIISA